jgi:hypothetical protein
MKILRYCATSLMKIVPCNCSSDARHTDTENITHLLWVYKETVVSMDGQLQGIIFTQLWSKPEFRCATLVGICYSNLALRNITYYHIIIDIV